MCGIAGLISNNSSEVNYSVLKKMTDALQHRGPDGEGHWISGNGKAGLGHRRLSIIDLSTAASQPMHYMGRYTMVFNGEIYNYIELKEQLLKQGYLFSTSSDTEVLMAYYDWKKEKCLDFLDGMFAFVLYDAEKNEIFCVRDRFGEKPFYYCHNPGKHFYFSSEMKALWAAGITKEADNSFLYNYISTGRIIDPSNPDKTFFKSIYSLEQSSYLKANLDTLEIRIEKYWDINVTENKTDADLEQVKETFSFLMEESVKRRLRSDVPVGSSLSGGLDSSLIVCLINKLNNTNFAQNTFSARFPGFNKDEGDYIKMVIDRTNVSPHFVYPNEVEMIDEFDKLIFHQEEPFGSASIYAQYCVMKLARENNVTVLLDGQGADEILAGYHFYIPAFFKELKAKNKAVYLSEKEAYEKSYAGSFNYTGEPGYLKQAVQQYAPAAVIHKLRQFKVNRAEQKNKQFTKDFFATYKPALFKDKPLPGSLNEFLKQQTMFDLQQLLRFADRNSMAHSREVRLPFLSKDLVEFLFTLPATYKIKQGWTKWIMRTTFSHLLPAEIAWRKDKIGYEPPQYNWMENAKFKELIQESNRGLVKNGILNSEILNRPITPHSVNDGGINHAWRHLLAGKMLQ